MDHDFTVPTDYWGNNASDLRKKKLFLFDMDGTIYEENILFKGTLELLNTIIRNNGKYVFITNNSSKSVSDYIEKVKKMGIPANQDNFFTSTQATALYLKKYYPNTKVYCLGTKSMITELQHENINITEEVEEDVQVVLVGFDTELTSKKICKTCEILKNDIPYIATNPDLKCPVSFGFIPDCGAICGMIECATSKKPIYIGKPEPIMVDIVREKFGCSKEETVVIGDRLYTDIAVGLNAGIAAVCVLTGEATESEIKKSNITPTYTFQSVLEIWKAIQAEP